jgi:hypothetical protein
VLNIFLPIARTPIRNGGADLRICGNGHHIRGPEDKLNDDTCRHCHNDRQRRHAERQKDGIALVRKASDRGLTARQALEFIAYAPIELLRHWEKLDPWAMQQIRDTIAARADA